MSYPYDDGHGRTVVSVLAGVVVGALLVGLIWLAQERSGSGDPAADRAATTPQSQPMDDHTSDGVPADAAEGDPDTVALGRCQEVYDAQAGALEAAAESLDQWEVHIGAMNKLVTGAISLQQANQFWNQTRVGAADRLDRFDAAFRRFSGRTARCPEPARSEEIGAGLRTCATAVAARSLTLRRASVALETWRMHVHHMEMLRTGAMTAEEATRLWLQSWHQGAREVRAYRAAAKAAGQATTC